MAAYRDDLLALDARHAALSHELAAKTRELADATRLLEEAKTRAKLPILDNIRVATPCTADWAKMTGDERTRACADCNKRVYNLSNLTRDEAQALLIEKEGKLCVRYYQRTDGTILLKDCSIGVGRRRKRRLIAAGAAALLAGVGGWIVLAKQEPTDECVSAQLPDETGGRQAQIKVTGHESVERPHYEVMLGDADF